MLNGTHIVNSIRYKLLLSDTEDFIILYKMSINIFNCGSVGFVFKCCKKSPEVKDEEDPPNN